ncbi:glycosyltransferase family 2 protein [Candidatus Oleimmundimicrobium sp.]|uniref:glycosyltransferase family 2 protein n=1 Tax=Candidatus Oleimmundimicrobium sp. TaxID=3060597 RepID=UPI0027174C1D|nr:glycosyltransferase family 2 protein [Candidatus Oleimmundimicrobium sp.]MDO8886939.1 glycosyltransferase family 2 protein [Candidatus Oleimmundimicrobium sp.]
MSELSIIIVNWNGKHFLKDCLDSVFKQSLDDCSVVFIDNGSTDDSVRFVEKKYASRIKNRRLKIIVNNKNYGFAEGNNIGIEESLKDLNCKYIFCLNNDTVIESNCLDELIKIADDPNFKHFGSFQPKMVWHDYRELIDSAGLLYGKNSLGFNRGGFEAVKNYDQSVEILGCCGGACLYRRKAVEELIEKDGEFFDKDFFAYYEDFDVAFRLQWRGWPSFYVSNSIVYHKRGGSQKKSTKKTLYWGHRNNVYVIAKNLPKSFIFKNFILILSAQILSIAINFIKRGLLGFTIAKAKIDGFRNWAKMREKAKIIQSNSGNWPNVEKFLVSKWRMRKPKR